MDEVAPVVYWRIGIGHTAPRQRQSVPWLPFVERPAAEEWERVEVVKPAASAPRILLRPSVISGRRNFDVAAPAGDFNNDGFVNGDDYDAFASAFDAGC